MKTRILILIFGVWNIILTFLFIDVAGNLVLIHESVNELIENHNQYAENVQEAIESLELLNEILEEY